ncbi:MAG: rhodanese-like domain-containing protein [Candidatus Acidiferrales bacterium]
MPSNRKARLLEVFAGVACFLICLGASLAILPLLPASAAAPQTAAAHSSSDPWTSSETVQPAELANDLKNGKESEKPVVVCVGFHTLYEGAHVSGAIFHGPASTPAGLDDLKLWARSEPRSANIVIYCGCCPLSHCPNIRPAFNALHSMGFTHLRVLLLPQDFASDWVAKGYAVEKGK